MYNVFMLYMNFFRNYEFWIYAYFFFLGKWTWYLKFDHDMDTHWNSVSDTFSIRQHEFLCLFRLIGQHLWIPPAMHFRIFIFHFFTRWDFYYEKYFNCLSRINFQRSNRILICYCYNECFIILIEKK